MSGDARPTAEEMLDRSVRETMTTRMFAVCADTGLDVARRLMMSKRISGAPVIGAEGDPIGVVSLVDLIDPDSGPEDSFGFDNYYEVDRGNIDARGTGSAVEGGRVREVMTRGVVSVSPRTCVSDAAALMAEHRIHRLVVIDGDRMVGMFTALDLARAVSG